MYRRRFDGSSACAWCFVVQLVVQGGAQAVIGQQAGQLLPPQLRNVVGFGAQQR